MNHHNINNSAVISVIMPAFNARLTILSSIQSVVEQTFTNWELIIVNDGSTDNTGEIVIAIQKFDQRIKLVAQSNKGLSAARNTGIKHASGKWICFLDSDDLWLPNKLTVQYQFHLKNNVSISHARYGTLTNGSIKFTRLYVKNIYRKDGNLLPTLYWINLVGVLTVMVEKQLLEEIGGFDENLWTMEDIDLWIRIAKKNVSFGYIPDYLAIYRINTLGISKNTSKYMDVWKIFMEKLDNNPLAMQYQKKYQAVFYHTFGVGYFKANNMEQAYCFLLKALRLYPCSIIGLSGLPFLIISFFRLNFFKNKYS
jgi:glycosyltransferase involved in cell wall biosynthesis